MKASVSPAIRRRRDYEVSITRVSVGHAFDARRKELEYGDQRMFKVALKPTC